MLEDTLAGTRVGDAGPRPRADGAPPATIGRYTVLKRLGEGGMGVVYAAYDTELDRKVAIKLLHRDLRDGGSVGNSRLLREAQAMAKISHPNVLQVYEAGTHAGQIFLALEHVEGSTLGAWCEAEPRAWRDVLDKFLQAGEGLHAAHAVGIVHRDFKPDNVLVDGKGRVRVMDFGLARAAHVPESERTREAMAALVDGRTSVSLELSLTQTGAAVGTPAYMAPEQYTGQPIDARTDEFAFCVALWEGLCGQRPFVGDDLRALIQSVLSGDIREPPRGRKIPGWIRRALQRGMSIDPDARYPTVAALLAALRADPAVRRRRAAVAVFSVMAIGAGAWGYVAAVESAAAACRGGAERFAEVWDQARAEAVASAFAATGRPYAAAAAERVRERLDAHAATWATIHGEACEAHQRGEQSSELLDRRMACLERRRDEVAALVEVFAAADGEVVDRAFDAAQGLGSLAACSDLAALQHPVEPPPAGQEEAVTGVRRRLAAAEAAFRAGRYKQALALIEPEVAAAEALEYRPLLAEAALLSARILVGLLRPEEGHAELLRAVWAAEASRHDEVAAEAWTFAVRVAGAELGQIEDAARWFERASAAVARIGDPPLARANLLNARGAVGLHASRPADALPDFEAALRLLQGLYGDDDLQLARVYNNIGNALVRLRRFDEALQAHERGLALRVRHLGEQHPDVAASLNNFGVMYKNTGKLDEAYRSFERAEAIWAASVGADNPVLINAVQNMATVTYARGDVEATARLLARAEALASRSLPPDSPLASTLRGNLGAMHLIRGAYAEAEVVLTAELARRESIHGSDSATVADLLGNLGQVLTIRGEHRRAREYLTRDVLAIREPGKRADQFLLLTEGALALGELTAAEGYLRDAEAEIAASGKPDGRPVALILGAEVARRKRDLPRAVALVREAPAEFGPTYDDATRAGLSFVRARVLWEAKIDRPAARAEAEAALATLRSRPGSDPARLAEVEAFVTAPPK